MCWKNVCEWHQIYYWSDAYYVWGQQILTSENEGEGRRETCTKRSCVTFLKKKNFVQWKPYVKGGVRRFYICVSILYDGVYDEVTSEQCMNGLWMKLTNFSVKQENKGDKSCVQRVRFQLRSKRTIFLNVDSPVRYRCGAPKFLQSGLNCWESVNNDSVKADSLGAAMGRRCASHSQKEVLEKSAVFNT